MCFDLWNGAQIQRNILGGQVDGVGLNFEHKSIFGKLFLGHFAFYKVELMAFSWHKGGNH